MRNQEELRALTGLRGAAACFVVIYHYSGGGIGFGPLAGFVQRGYQAVDLFFVLSGYVLAMTYAERLQGRLSISHYVEFILRRLARVYPLFIVVTLVLLLIWPPPSGWPAVTITTNVLLIQSWGLADSIGGPTWSISTEFAAYLLFPAVCYAVVWGSALGSTATALLAFAVVVFISSRDTALLQQIDAGRFGPLDIFQGTTVYPLLRCLGEFTLGAAGFRLGRSAFASRIASLPGLADACIASIAILMFIPRTDVFLPLVFAALILSLAKGNSLTEAALSSKAVHWLGLISYSIYLIHRPFEQALRPSLRVALTSLHVPHAFSVSGALLLIPMIAISALAHAFVEEPGRRLLRVSRQRQAAPLHLKKTISG